jgi:hypothetical protein
VLSDRQRRILQMSFEGWSVQDISDELRLRPASARKIQGGRKPRLASVLRRETPYRVVAFVSAWCLTPRSDTHEMRDEGL